MLKSLYLYSLALWTGSLFLMLVVCIPVSFKTLGKSDAFKLVDSALPKYFNISYIFGITSLLSFYFLVKGISGILLYLNLSIILLANIISFVNGIFVSPKARMERVTFIREGKEKVPLKCKLSTTLNVLTLILCLLSIGITSTLIAI